MIYVVTRGKYSDYYIVGVFSTKDKAEECANLFDPSDPARIEEYQLDPELPVKRNEKVWEVTFIGESINVEEYYPGIEPIKSEFVFHDVRAVIIVFAEDSVGAAKIAREKRAIAVANNQWRL